MLSVEQVDRFDKFLKKLESDQRTIPAEVSTAKNEVTKWVSIDNVLQHMSHDERCQSRYRYKVIDTCRKLVETVEADTCYKRLVEGMCCELGGMLNSVDICAGELVAVSCISSYLLFDLPTEWREITSTCCEQTYGCCGLDTADAAMVKLIEFTEHAMCANGIRQFRGMYDVTLRIALAKLQRARIEIKQNLEFERCEKEERVRQQHEDELLALYAADDTTLKKQSSKKKKKKKKKSKIDRQQAVVVSTEQCIPILQNFTTDVKPDKTTTMRRIRTSEELPENNC